MLKFFLMAVYVAAVQSSNTRDRIYYEEKFFNWLSFFKIEPPTGSSGDPLEPGENFKFQSNYLTLANPSANLNSPGMHFVRWLQNFANNDDIIVAHNLKKLSYTLGHNQFSHMTYDQWRAAVHFGLDRASSDNRYFIPSLNANLHTLATSATVICHQFF